MKFNRYSNGNARRKLRDRYRRSGITNCPVCGVPLDWNTPYLPNSAEIDEIVPVSKLPYELRYKACLDPHNTQVLCRRCNKQKSDKLNWQPGKPKETPKPETPPTSNKWV